MKSWPSPATACQRSTDAQTSGQPYPAVELLRCMARRDVLLGGETKILGEITVTTSERTAFDIGRRQLRRTAVALLDALMRATGFKVHDVLAVAERHRGARGLRRLETTLKLVNPGAQSPEKAICAYCSSTPAFATANADPGAGPRRRCIRLPRHGLAGPDGRRRLRRRPSSGGPMPIREGHSAARSAAANRLAGSPGRGRRPSCRNRATSQACPRRPPIECVMREGFLQNALRRYTLEAKDAHSARAKQPKGEGEGAAKTSAKQQKSPRTC